MADVYALPFRNWDKDDPFHHLRPNGSRHRGVDFPVPVGTPIPAVGRGRIVLMEASSALGYVTVVRHTRTTVDRLLGRRPVYSGYCHQNHPYERVHVGQTVELGDIIGLSGDKGYVTGPHLHLTFSHHLRGVFDGEVFDPIAFILRYPAKATPRRRAA